MVLAKSDSANVLPRSFNGFQHPVLSRSRVLRELSVLLQILRPSSHGFGSFMRRLEQLALALVQASQKLGPIPQRPARIMRMVCDLRGSLFKRLFPLV